MDVRRLIAAGLVACFVLRAQGEEGKKLSAADAKRLVAEAVGADAKKAAAARKTLEATRAADRKEIAAALAKTPFVAPKGRKAFKGRTLEDALDVPSAETKKGKVLVTLPKDYDDKKAFPVLFRFHGSGDTAADFAKNTIEAKQPFICVTPEIPSASRNAWNETGGHAFVDGLFRYVLENFNADPERVYLSGHSAGGGASVMMAQVWPHRVAAFYDMARTAWAYHLMPEPCMDTLREIPGYFVVGLKDTEDRISGFRTAEAYYKKAGLPGVFHFVEGRGHDYMQEHHQKAYDYMLKSTRKPHAKDVRGVFFGYSDAAELEEITRRRWWIDARAGGYDLGGTVFHAVITDNVVAIDAPKLKSFFVLLNDALVDMDKPVVVKLNDREVHNAVVERSVPFLLDGFAAERDRGRLYWNRIEVKAP